MELLSLIVAMLLTGAVAGVLAGLLGVGGGIVIVPALEAALGILGVDVSVRMHIAVATSLATIIPTSISSAAAHYRKDAIDIAVVHKVWERVGARVQLVVDNNRGMNAADAMRLSLACRDIPFAFEQPCNTMEEVASIRPQIAHPIIIDENLESLSEVMRAISMRVCDGFGLKLTRMGGLNAMATIRDVCAARSIPHTCEDSWGGDILAAAIVHIGATVEPRLLEAIWTAGIYIEENYDPENGINVDSGYFDVPTGPGLGINPDESRIGKLVASYA